MKLQELASALYK